MVSYQPDFSVNLSRHAEIDAFEPSEWDRLLPAGAFYGSHSWLRSVERHDTFRASYIAARNDAGRLLGALPLYTASGAPAERAFDPSVQFGQAFSTDFFPATIVGLRAGYSTEFPLDQRLSAQAGNKVLGSLVDACFQATPDDTGSFSILYAKSEIMARLAVIPMPTCRVFNAPYATLSINWDSFDGYLDSQSPRRRRSMVQDIMAFEKSGCSLTYASLPDCYLECAPLAAKLQQRYGAMDSVPAIEDRLAEQALALGTSSLCILCRLHGKLVGFSLLYRWRDELYARIVGFDYENLPADSRAYFSVLFYEPVRYAIANKITVIDYGLELGDPKVGRGCALAPRWSITFGHAAATGSPAAREENLDALERMRMRYGRYSTALPSALWATSSWRRLGAIPDAGMEA